MQSDALKHREGLKIHIDTSWSLLAVILHIEFCHVARGCKNEFILHTIIFYAT